MEITKRQIKKIHVYASLMGLSYDEYKDLLKSRYGVSSCKEFTRDQAAQVLKDFRRVLEFMGIDPDERIYPKRFDDLAGRPGMAFPAQLRKIEALWQYVSKAKTAKEKKKALRTFLKNRFGISDIRFIPIEKAYKVIYTLEVMRRQKNEEEKQRILNS